MEFEGSKTCVLKIFAILPGRKAYLIYEALVFDDCDHVIHKIIIIALGILNITVHNIRIMLYL